jgi:nucleotide-binding universal stress UspA family protein
MGIDHVEAYVTEIQTKVPLTPDDSPEDIILKAEYGEFLEATKVDTIIPDVEFKLTFPGQYPILEEHIRVHRHYMGLDQQREIPWEEAVWHWFYHVYTPVIEIIRDQNLLEEFPGKTETDLYIWILDHQSYMEQELGWSIRPEKAAVDLLSVRGKRFFRVLRRATRKVLQALIPYQLEDFSKTGEWHQQKQVERDSLFSDILVPISGSPESWIALEQAIIIAEMEKADVRGLAIKRAYEWGEKHISDEDLSRAFSERLQQSGIRGNLVFVQGKVAETICERAKVNDLVILKLNHPPLRNIFARLKSGMRTIVRKSTRPLLFVCGQLSTMNHILLAYDGSPKGKEALYIAAYLASRYKKHLSVLVVDDDEARGKQRLSEAKNYLGARCVSQVFRKRTGRTSLIILQAAEDIRADMILMGGYGRSPVFEILFGSTVDGVLRGTQIPVVVSQ